jgi:cobalt-zinc-cadmium efflux system outer membrane protein
MSIHQVIKSSLPTRQHRMRFSVLYLLLSASLSAMAQTSEPLVLDSLVTQAEIAAVTEPAQALTIEAAIRLALERNPNLAAARREIEAADAQILQGSLRPNPEFVYLAEDTRSVSRTSTAQLDVPIEMGGKRGARVDAATRNKNAALSELTARQLQIRASTMGAFFEVVAAQEQTVLARDTLVLAMRASDIAGKRVTAGKISPVEEVKARVAEAGVRLSLTQAESELRNARRRLSSLWGNPSPRFTEVVGELDRMPDLPTRAAVQARLAISPVLERAQQEVERRKSLVTVEQTKTVPDITFTLGMKRREDVTRDQLMVGVSIPLPVFNRNQGNLLEALKREDKARDELAATKLTLYGDALQILERISARREETELLQKSLLPGAKWAYEAATIGFENGKFSFLEVLDAQRTYFSAKSQYLTAFSALYTAITDLESLLGGVEGISATSSVKE